MGKPDHSDSREVASTSATRAPVNACRLRFECPRTWESLQPTRYEGLRYCGECRRNVYYCDSREKLGTRVRQGVCVAAPSQLLFQGASITGAADASRRSVSVGGAVPDFGEEPREDDAFEIVMEGQELSLQETSWLRLLSLELQRTELDRSTDNPVTVLADCVVRARGFFMSPPAWLVEDLGSPHATATPGLDSCGPGSGASDDSDRRTRDRLTREPLRSYGPAAACPVFGGLREVISELLFCHYREIRAGSEPLDCVTGAGLGVLYVRRVQFFIEQRLGRDPSTAWLGRPVASPEDVGQRLLGRLRSVLAQSRAGQWSSEPSEPSGVDKAELARWYRRTAAAIRTFDRNYPDPRGH